MKTGSSQEQATRRKKEVKKVKHRVSVVVVAAMMPAFGLPSGSVGEKINLLMDVT